MQFPLPVPPEQVYRVATTPPPPPFMPATVSEPIPCLFSLILIFLADPTCYCKCRRITHLVFQLAGCSGEYSISSGSHQVHAIDGWGGRGAFVEILYNRSHPRPRRILLLHICVHSTKYTNCTLTPSPTGNQTPCSRSLIARANPVSSEHAVPAIIVWSPRGKLYVRCHLWRTTFVGEGGAARSCPVS